MVETQDMVALIEAVNNWDDSVLPILCDLLEEQGSSLYVGLREIIRQGKCPCDQKLRNHRDMLRRENPYTWYNAQDQSVIQSKPNSAYPQAYFLPCYRIDHKIYFKLKGTHKEVSWASDYNTRWGAYADLARVLSEECE